MSESPVAEEQHLAVIEGQPKKPQRGGRKPLSCLACRRHKLKCDRKVPCGTCIRYHREALCRLNPAPPKRARSGEGEPPRADIGSETVVDIDLESPDAVDDALSAPVRESITAVAAGGGVVTLRNSHLIPGFDEPKDTPFFLRTLGLDANTTAIPVSSLTQLLAEIQRASHPSVFWHMMEGPTKRRYWETQLRSVLPSRSMCDLLLNYYLDHINWIFQITHVPSFRREYEEFWDGAEDRERELDFIFTALLFSILSVSALYIPPGTVEIFGCPRESIRDLAHVWHKASHQALIAGDYESKPCIVQLQTFSITQFYWYATNGIDALNSRLGQAVRTAQMLGLDKDVNPSQTLHDEMRHRIWWDLVDSDTFQSICLDRPPLIRLESPGVPLPLNCNDSDITELFLQPRPHDEPTIMMVNIFRARFFKLMNYHICFGSPDDAHSYEAICKLDDEILNITRTYPWFYQLDQEGRPPPLPQPLGEILTWQNHIIRTCISTQRIRMYRPFLSTRVGDSWAKCIEAAEDAMAVYRTIRTNRSITSLQKFLPQVYQIFSVAVTVTALLLVEGSLPIMNARQQIRDMAEDLQILEDQGCVSIVASRGRQVLLKMLRLVDVGNNAIPAPEEDADSLVSDIAFIFGGEQAARSYMQRLASRNQRLKARTSSASTTKQQPTPTSMENFPYSNPQQFKGMIVDDSTMHVSAVETPMEYITDQTTGAYQMNLMMDDMVLQNLLNFDMTALMADTRYG
ncbi:transcription factor [Trichoderma arundinaceum]|uniref:Transcription factor n=1 Tax=Trichoderma arundinaceum TaxID=490622 RepID=A0A395NLP5_TRIAR|nr:transcription factor [Trichoderma arundinaceum]